MVPSVLVDAVGIIVRVMQRMLGVLQPSRPTSPVRGEVLVASSIGGDGVLSSYGRREGQLGGFCGDVGGGVRGFSVFLES